jgi:hypothetical protein
MLTSPPSVSRLSRKYGSFDVSHPYGPPRLVIMTDFISINLPNTVLNYRESPSTVHKHMPLCITLEDFSAVENSHCSLRSYNTVLPKRYQGLGERVEFIFRVWKYAPRKDFAHLA